MQLRVDVLPAVQDLGAAEHRRVSVAVLAVGAFLLFAASLLVDCVPRFHLGDSESYLWTSLKGWMPDDRSWIYGLFATLLIGTAKDLAVVPVWGAFLSLATGFGFALFLARRYALGSLVTVVLALAYVANPLEFFWSRSIMADSMAVAAFVAFLALLFGVRRLGPLVVIALLPIAFLLIGLRVVYFLPLIVALLVAALIGHLVGCRRGEPPGPRCVDARRSAAGFLILLAAYGAYSVVSTRMGNAPWVSANHASARFLLGALSPALAPEVKRLPLADGSRLIPLTRENRLLHTFAHHGLVETFNRQAGSRLAAEPQYREALIIAIRENPSGVLRLVLQAWADYLDLPLLLQYHREGRFSGATDYMQPATLPDNVLQRLRALGVWQQVPADFPRIGSRALHWFKVGGGVWSWTLTVLASLGLVLALVFRAWRDPFLLVLLVFSFVYCLLVVVASNEVVTRYFLPQTVVVMALVAATMARRVKRNSAPTGPSASGDTAALPHTRAPERRKGSNCISAS